MKSKFLVALAALFVFMSLSAQEQEAEVRSPKKRDKAAGIHLNVGSISTDKMEITPNFGIGGKYQVNVSDHVRIEPNYDFFFGRYNPKSEHLAFWYTGADAHYIFKPCRIMNIYSILGVGVNGTKYRIGYFSYHIVGLYDNEGNYREEEVYSEGFTGIGNFFFRVGGGLEFKLSKNLWLDITAKKAFLYKLDEWTWRNQAWSASLGFVYHFKQI